MIDILQIEELSRKYKTNTTVIAREYLQLLFLQNFYELPGSEAIYFKGGTAIHFLMEGYCFSEDLDFTSEAPIKTTHKLITSAVKKMQAVLMGLKIKEKRTLSGKSYLLTLEKGLVNFPIFISLDMSFRENVLQKKRGIIKSDFPVIFSSFIHYLGGEEILAEKARAVLTRDKGRDLFDLWFLFTKGFKINNDFIREKMKYYPKIHFQWEKVINKVNKYDFNKFKNDLMPFISIDKRLKIEEMFTIVKTGIVNNIIKR